MYEGITQGCTTTLGIFIFNDKRENRYCGLKVDYFTIRWEIKFCFATTRFRHCIAPTTHRLFEEITGNYCTSTSQQVVRRQSERRRWSNSNKRPHNADTRGISIGDWQQSQEILVIYHTMIFMFLLGIGNRTYCEAAYASSLPNL